MQKSLKMENQLQNLEIIKDQHNAANLRLLRRFQTYMKSLDSHLLTLKSKKRMTNIAAVVKVRFPVLMDQKKVTLIKKLIQF